MLSEYLSHTGALEGANISETLKSTKVTLKLSDSKSDFVLKLFDELKTLSHRDRFELFLEICGTHEKITDCSIDSREKITAHLEEFQEESEFEIELNIEKTIQGSTISIYFIGAFCDYLANERLMDSINEFSEHFDQRLEFEVFSTIKSFNTESICFFPAGDISKRAALSIDHFRMEKLEFFTENTTSINIQVGMLPSDFYMSEESPYGKLNEFFKYSCSLLCWMFLSNSSELKADNMLTYKVCGYKTVACRNSPENEFSRNYGLLYKIYSWAYERGNNSDKLGLTRNVMSIHLDEAGKIKIDQPLWEAIQSNYQIYLKANIKSYLEVKNKIGEIIIESISKTYLMADELLGSLKQNAAVVLTFLLTVVVVNGLKDSGERAVFSNTYLAVVIVLSLLSALWLFITRNEILERFDDISATLAAVLKSNYNKVLMEAEIDESINPVVEINRRNLRSRVKRYTWWWIFMLVVFVGLFMIFNYQFSHPTARAESSEIDQAPCALGWQRSLTVYRTPRDASIFPSIPLP